MKTPTQAKKASKRLCESHRKPEAIAMRTKMAALDVKTGQLAALVPCAPQVITNILGGDFRYTGVQKRIEEILGCKIWSEL
jgi:hypothetical protein